MRIAVFGTGGVGGYFGGLLAHGGNEVHFIARGEHLAAMQANGLKVKSVNGSFELTSVAATDDPKEIGPVEYVVVAVKHYQLADAAQQMIPLIDSGTTVVPLLNGVDAHEVLIDALGPESVVGGLCSVVSFIEEPGVINQPSKLQRVVVGELSCKKSDRVEKLVSAWGKMGAEAVHSANIFVSMWTKFLFIASFGGISALARATMGELLKSKETSQLFLDAMREVESLARKQDINLASDVVDSMWTMANNFEYTATSSMQRDVAAGNVFELEAFNGRIVRLAKELGVPTPIHRAIYSLLLPALEQAKQASR
jgi:2-dehydropantoate 2-reductase